MDRYLQVEQKTVELASSLFWSLQVGIDILIRVAGIIV